MIRLRTHDDTTVADASRIRFYVTEKLGPKQKLTPEGFLLCEGVPLARTGEMAYAEGELDDLKGDASGVIYVTRDEAAVFDPVYMASLNGKPAVNEHPEEDVSPENWRNHAIGVVMNIRRGTGDEADLLLGDMLIWDAQAIEDIQSGKREVSAGYTADYDEIGPGKARQYNLIGNHIALVESGRCGPRCSIGDRKTVQSKTGDCSMTTKTKRLSWIDRISEALKLKKTDDAQRVLDEAREEVEAEPEERTQDVHIYAGDSPRSMRDEDLENRFKKIEDGMGGMAESLGAINTKLGITSTSDADDPDEEEEKEEKKAQDAVEEESNGGEKKEMRSAKDSSFLADSFQEANAGAEILVPGIQLRSYDKSMAPRKTVEAINGTRKTALALALATVDGQALLEELNGGKAVNLETMDCAGQRNLFRSAVVTRKARNNTGITQDVITSGGGLGVTGPVKSPADLNKKMREHFARTA